MRAILAVAVLAMAACGETAGGAVDAGPCAGDAAWVLECDPYGNPLPTCGAGVTRSCPAPLVEGGCGVATGLYPVCEYNDFSGRNTVLCVDTRDTTRAPGSGQLMLCVPPSPPDAGPLPRQCLPGIIGPGEHSCQYERGYDFPVDCQRCAPCTGGVSCLSGECLCGGETIDLGRRDAGP